MGRRNLSNIERAEAVLHAVVHGDESAADRYKITERTIRRYREEVREPGSKLSEIVRGFSAAIAEAQGDEVAAAEAKAGTLLDFIDGQVRKLSDIVLRKAEEINAANPASIEAVNAHVATLLGHAAALQYIASLFGSQGAEAEGPE